MGKAQSSRNAIKHGLTARNALLADEDPEEYSRLQEAFVAELAPEGALELELVDGITSTAWRLRRVPIFEAALMAAIENKIEEDWLADVRLVSRDEPMSAEASKQLALGRVIEKLAGV